MTTPFRLLLPPHLLIAPLGVDCKFAVPYNKKTHIGRSNKDFFYFALLLQFLILSLSLFLSFSMNFIHGKLLKAE
jgi:hypothetical protein